MREYLRDLQELMGPEIRDREYETVSEERTEGNPLGLYCLTPELVRQLARENSGPSASPPRPPGARGSASSTPGADGTLEITVGATNTKGAMPWDEPSSPSTTSTPT